MPWWGWIAVGALLLVAEMTVVDLEFYLVFLGVSALSVGMLELAGISMAYWMQWVVFSVFAVASLVIFRKGVYAKMRPPPESEIQHGVEGDRAIALEEIEPGAMGSVRLRGASWTGINRDSKAISEGARCRVDRSEGLTLDLRLDD